MGSSKVSPTPGFFCKQYERDDFSVTSQRPIFTKFGHGTWIVVETQTLDTNLRKVSIQGSFAPKTPNFEEVKQVPHSVQATGQRMHCEDILFTPRCSSRAKEFPVQVNVFVRRTVAEPRGVKFAWFSDFRLFFPYKTLKSSFRWPAYSPGFTSQNDSDFSVWYSKVQRGGAFRHRGFPVTSGRGAGDPKLAKIFTMANGCTHTECYYIWTKDV